MKIIISFIWVFTSITLFGQEGPSIKFGKISETDLRNRTYPIDTGARAVVLADIGTTKVVGNSKASVSLEFKKHKRIHILKKSGYDLATIEIDLYKEDELEEQIKDLRAATYNLENGKLVETKVNEKTALFKERIDGNRIKMKLTFPNVKEGSIIEYEYRIISDYLFNLQPWLFQSSIPHLWSQYTVAIPEFLDYMLVEYGDLPYYAKDQKDKDGQYFINVTKDAYRGVQVTDRYDFSCAVAEFRWAMKDVRAFDEEPFLSSARNHMARLEFQLAGYLPPFMEKKIMTTWPDMSKDMLERSDFGAQLTNPNNEFWAADLLKDIPQGVTQTQKAQNIYNYVRDNFKCTSHNQLFMDEPINKIVSKRSGGVAEINLVLTCLLRKAGLQADPVILSTRWHGYVNNSYPIARPFNYVICRVNADGKDVLLDASRPNFGFGRLHHECYNGPARVMNNAATLIQLKTDQLTEKKQTTIFIHNDPNGKWSGYVKKLYGYFDSDEIRQTIAADGMVGMQKQITDEYGNELKVDSLGVDSLLRIGDPVSAHFIIRSTSESSDIIYISPVLGERFKQNPFKAANRKYPIDLPYKQKQTYTINMEIPRGYIVDEMPKPVTLRLNAKNDALFEYRISESAGAITMTYNLDINRTQFAPEEYNMLREFFANLVSKLEEQIVFKNK